VILSKFFLVILTGVFFLLEFSVCSACVASPFVELQNGCNFYYEGQYLGEETNFTLEMNNLETILDFLSVEKEICGFSDSDLPILAGFISNGYFVKEQTESEYLQFLKIVKEDILKRPIYCPGYTAVARNGSWTGYISENCDYDSTTGSCSCTECAIDSPTIIWNDLPSSISTVQNQTENNSLTKKNSREIDSDSQEEIALWPYALGFAGLFVLMVIIFLVIYRRQHG
jgi:hypothetical protein